MNTVVKFEPLTPEQESKLKSYASDMMDQMWGDLMSALAEEGKRSISQADILEVAMDAGRLEEDSRSKDPELSQWLSIHLYTPEGGKYVKELLTQVFPHKRYS